MLHDVVIPVAPYGEQDEKKVGTENQDLTEKQKTQKAKKEHPVGLESRFPEEMMPGSSRGESQVGSSGSGLGL